MTGTKKTMNLYFRITPQSIKKTGQRLGIFMDFEKVYPKTYTK